MMRKTPARAAQDSQVLRGMAKAICLVWMVAFSTEVEAQDSSAEALFEPAKPHLEAVLGKPFASPIRFRPSAADDLLKIPDAESIAEARCRQGENGELVF